MFTGLCAFPLTPFRDECIDFQAFEKLLSRLTDAKVDSICAMGSTGLYPYLDHAEFQSVAEKTVALADGIPVMVGIGALRTKDVLQKAYLAQQAGVKAVLLAPVSYHPLTEAEVYNLYAKVSAELSVPLCVYENPGVTQFTFSDELYAEVARLNNVAAIKIPGMPFANAQGAERLARLRSIVPANMAIGVSGDKFAVAGLQAGCDLWLSVVGGLFPQTAMRIVQAIKDHQAVLAIQWAEQLEPLWQLFVRNWGGMRVMATAADILGITESNCLPQPLQPLTSAERASLETLLTQLNLS
ncbi:dihydrodipicolinate synthase family protein [Bowmanella denitrificans]|uniref:Dihydrodipicolinate synthase family protein n=1 Tax=Bowmanella denitrificans TaxID=366582 RepID=A0ABN0XR75_9ALTE